MMTLMLLVSRGLAQQDAGSVQKITLTPTPHGLGVYLVAQTSKGIRFGSEVFTVNVQGDIEDDEIIVGDDEVTRTCGIILVLIDTVSGEENVPVGGIVMSDGQGYLQLTRSRFGGKLPLPVSEIKTVKLLSLDGLLAQGSFSTE
jgi:hypothetical protein